MDYRRIFWIGLILWVLVGCQTIEPQREDPTATPTSAPTATPIPETWDVVDLGSWPQLQATAVSYHPTKPIVAVVVGFNVYFYDTNTFALIHQIEAESPVATVHFAPDGELMALFHPAQNSVAVWQWSAAVPQRIDDIAGGEDVILAVAFANDGLRLGTSAGGSLWQFSEEGVKEQQLGWTNDYPQDMVSFSQDGSLLLSTILSDTIQHTEVWSLTEGVPLHAFSAETDAHWLSTGQLAADNVLLANILVDGVGAQAVIRPLPAPHLQQSWQLPIVPTAESWAMSPNGRFLLTDLGEGQVGVWEATSAELLTQLPLESTSPITHITFAEDGQWVATAQAGGQVQWWRWGEEGFPIGEPFTFDGQRGKIRQLHFAPDGTQLVLVSAKGLVEFVDTAVSTQTYALTDYTTDAIQSLAFSADGQRLAVGREDGQVHLWQVAGQRREQILPNHQGGVDSVAFTPDNKLLATGIGERVSDLSFDDTVRLWDGVDLVQQFGGEKEDVIGCSLFKNSVAFSPDGSVLAAGSHDFTIHLWDVAVGKALRTLAGHTDGVFNVAFAPDGTLLASASQDGTVGIWQWQTGELLQQWPMPPSGLTAVSFSPDGSLLVVGALTGKLYLWDVAEGALLRTFAGEMNQMSAVIFVGNGRFVAAGANTTDVQLWDVATGQIAHTLTRHTAQVRTVAYDPNSGLLFSGADDGLLHAWQLVRE